MIIKAFKINNYILQFKEKSSELCELSLYDENDKYLGAFITPTWDVIRSY